MPKGTNATPFNPQLQHFDYICGQVQQENRILKFVVIVATLSFFLSIGITIFAVSRPDSIPVLITMNDFGETQYIGPVSRRNYQNFNVPEVAVQAQVKEFISLTNTLSTDKTVMKKSVAKTYHLLTSTTAQKYLVQTDSTSTSQTLKHSTQLARRYSKSTVSVLRTADTHQQMLRA